MTQRVPYLLSLLLLCASAWAQISLSGTGVTLGGSARAVQYPFSDAYPSGDFSKWAGTFYLGQTPAQTAPDVQSVVIPPGQSKAAHMYYHATAGEGPEHHDVNIHFFRHFSAAEGFPNGVDDLTIQVYVLYHLEAGGTDGGTNNSFQRKIIFLKDVATEGGAVGNFVVTSDANKFRLAGGTWGACGGDNNSFSYGWAPPYLMTPPDRTWDTWFKIKVRIKLNTPGVADGILQFWVNDVQYLDYTAYNARGTCTQGWKRAEIGVQADRQAFDAINERRYFGPVIMSFSPSL